MADIDWERPGVGTWLELDVQGFRFRGRITACHTDPDGTIIIDALESLSTNIEDRDAIQQQRHDPTYQQPL